MTFQESRGEVLVRAIKGDRLENVAEECALIEKLLLSGGVINSVLELTNTFPDPNGNLITYENRLVDLLNSFGLPEDILQRVDETPKYALKSFLVNKLRLIEEDAEKAQQLLLKINSLIE